MLDVSSINLANYAVVTPLSLQSFAAEAYNTSPVYGPLSLPWYADYMHLVFWFFFLNVLVIVVWLSQTFAFVTRGGEGRFPVRETRGFSRAQTGDTLTAIIPMAWSITMLLQASTHSSNFDENTDATSLSLTVIAYQWGWSYFFPVDAVRVFNDSAQRQCFTATSFRALTPNNAKHYDAPSLCSARQSLDCGWVSLGLSAKSGSQLSTCLLSKAYASKPATSSTVLGLTSNAKTNSTLFSQLRPSSHTSLPRTPNSSIRTSTLIHTLPTVKLRGPSTLPNIVDCSALSVSASLGCATTANDYAQGLWNYEATSIRHRVVPSLPKLLDDVDMSFYSSLRGAEFGTTRQPSPASLESSWGGGLTRRMHVTAGLMLPSDTPIHVTCGSKDVVHSWAIPGLLIKIDCIPGYNAHRRLLIRWRGLFWGQCMEVCGRYHHWMPLLLNVAHADVFAAWLASNE